jgi:hypothetical protein
MSLNVELARAQRGMMWVSNDGNLPIMEILAILLAGFPNY